MAAEFMCVCAFRWSGRSYTADPGMRHDCQGVYWSTPDVLGLSPQVFEDVFATLVDRSLCVLASGYGQRRDALCVTCGPNRGADRLPSGIYDLILAAQALDLDVTGIVAGNTQFKLRGLFDTAAQMLDEAPCHEGPCRLSDHLPPGGYCRIADEFSTKDG